MRAFEGEKMWDHKSRFPKWVGVAIVVIFLLYQMGFFGKITISFPVTITARPVATATATP